MLMDKETGLILKRRALNLALEPQTPKDISTILEIIEFKISGETYGIETAYVMEVYPLKYFTPLPGVPSFILGIVNVRGQIFPVVNLKKFFNLPTKGLGELNKVIIIHNHYMEFGILADEIVGTNIIYLEDILPVPLSINGIGEKYLRGVTKNQIILLSAENILMDKNMIVNMDVN
jgi:purine-binding chemotaxis protein CheW